MVERADGWRASCEYNTDLYEADTVRGLLHRFETLLAGICADPDRRISEYPCYLWRDAGTCWKSAVGLVPGRPSKARRNAKTVWRRNETEQRLATLWSAFWESRRSASLRTSSMQVATLYSRHGSCAGQRSSGRKMSLALFLQNPTIEGVAAFLREEREEGPAETRLWRSNATVPGLRSILSTPVRSSDRSLVVWVMINRSSAFSCRTWPTSLNDSP